MFEVAGHEVIGTAVNGQVAIDEFKNLPEEPDVVIMDNRMPIKNGIEATVEILKISKHSIIVFASADAKVKEEALKAGAFSFIEKPFDINELLNNINEAQNRKI